MAIYNPEVYLSPSDKELLALLAGLLVDQPDNSKPSNRAAGEILLSNSEAIRLIELLEEFVQSRKFREGSYFADCLMGEVENQRDAREIYLSWRTRYGRTRAVATVQWQDFLMRLGLWRSSDRSPRVWYRPSAVPMDFDYFIKMERKLANAARLSPRVRELIITFVEARESAIDRLRCGDDKLKSGAILEPPKMLLDNLKQGQNNRIGQPSMSPVRIGAVMTIVLDTSTLFTTRDWSVAGFLSTIAGAIPSSMIDNR